MLRVDRGHTAAPGGGHGLPVDVVLHVARGEDPRHARPGAMLRDDVAVGVELDLTLKSHVFGVWPIAMNTPSSGSSWRLPVFRFRTMTEVTTPLSTSLTSSISESQMNTIFGFANALSCMIFDARSASRRW